MNSQIIQKNYLHLCLFVPAKFDNSKKIGWKLRFKILIQDHKLQVILILYYNFFIDVYTVSTLITHEKKKYRKHFLWQSWQNELGKTCKTSTSPQRSHDFQITSIFIHLKIKVLLYPVSYTHLTLPTNREV